MFPVIMTTRSTPIQTSPVIRKAQMLLGIYIYMYIQTRAARLDSSTASAAPKRVACDPLQVAGTNITLQKGKEGWIVSGLEGISKGTSGSQEMFI